MSAGRCVAPSREQGGRGTSGESPWWHRFFDDVYAGFGLSSADAAAIEATSAFLVDQLGLAPGMTVLDQCCGVGRLSLPLARRGMRVVGVDQAAGYVERAQAAALAEGLPGEFHCAEAGQFTAPRPCDAAFNWSTSLGYTPDDELTMRMLRRMYESLRPGGRAAVDYLNVPRVLGEFRPTFVHRPDPPDPDGLIVAVENQLNFLAGMIDSKWTFIHGDGRRQTRPVSTRVYLPHELARMLERCGFAGVALFGSVAGEPFELRSKRCILTASRPG